MAAKKKKYKIYCITEGSWIPGITVSDTIVAECPNNPAHEVKVETLSIDGEIELDNLSSSETPSSVNDVTEGYVVGSNWVNNITKDVYICADNAEGNAIWKKIPDDSPQTGGSGFFQFSFGEEMDYDQYLVSFTDNNTQKNRLKRSGNSSNGIRYGDCSPIVLPVSTTLKSALLSLKGGSVSTGTPASVVTAYFELWNVGWLNEGTKIADITFDIDTNVYPVGKWWNANGEDTNASINTVLDISVSYDSRLALKFKQMTGDDKLCTALGTTVSFLWEF